MKILSRLTPILSLAIAVAILLSSCGGSAPDSQSFPPVIIESTAQHLISTFDLARFETGGPSPENPDTVCLHFISSKRMELEESRKFFHEVMDELIYWMNAELAKRKPGTSLTEDDLDISIAFQYSDGRYLEKPYIAYIYLFENMVYYSSYDFRKRKLGHRSREPLKASALAMFKPTLQSELESSYDELAEKESN